MIIPVSKIIYAKFIVAANVTIGASMRYRLHNMGGERACAPGSMVLLTRLAKQVYRRSDDEVLGMQLRHLVALSYMRDHDACPQHELADAFCMDANNVVLLLNELEQLGFATRLRDRHDRRRHLVQLTPAGLKALGQAERAQEAIEDDVLAALTDSERATLHKLLTRTLRGIEPADGEAVERDAYSATTASIST
jgi:DNA-binding MarR family transcriptional regulator